MSVFDFSKMLFLGLGSIIVMAYYVTHLAESGVNDEFKNKLKNIVKSLKSSPVALHALITFSHISDNFFGFRLISFQAFFKSALLTICWVTFITIICYFAFPEYSAWINEANFKKVIFSSALPIVLSLIAIDFASLSATRLIFRKLKTKGLIKLILVLIIDLIISALIFYFGITSAKYFIVNPTWLSIGDSLSTWLYLDQLPIAMKTLNDLTSDMLIEISPRNYQIKGGWDSEVVYAFPEGIAFYSSLLTSVWLWMHILSYALLKLTQRIDIVKNTMLRFVEIDKKPFTAISIMLIVAYVIVSLFLIAVFATISVM
ncbi:hypothetical protein [Vibrio vulnificus]|uniref:hypothetical protein n=1 Tax=Vibrio vulnificus TaxID=672 RepID=UPI001FAEB26D|nr:hypothetical protein [Vibrio vulnificus]MCJ0818211.1 hypothetical protein [Vibrio vulnificus]